MRRRNTGLTGWRGFDIGEVITEYGIMQDLVLDFAARRGINLAGDPIHVITRFFSRAMATAANIYLENNRPTGRKKK